MKDKSSMSTLEFLCGGLFWAVSSMLWYRMLVFRCIEELTFGQSKRLLFGMVIFGVLSGAFILYRCQKTVWSMSMSLLIPYGFYTMMAYQGLIKMRVLRIAIICLSFMIVYMLLVMGRRIRKGTDWRKVLLRRLYKCFYGSQSILSVGMVLLMLSLGFPVVLGNSQFTPSIEPTRNEDGQKQTIENNMDILLMLQEELWEELTMDERLDVMQTIANIEVSYLGLPHELNVQAEDLSEGVLGSYDDSNYTIRLSIPHLRDDSAWEVLRSLTHEAYHSYSHRLIDAYYGADESVKNLRIYDKAVMYAAEYENYINSEEDVVLYYLQQCETDARAYAEEAVERYYCNLNEYLEEKKVN